VKAVLDTAVIVAAVRSDAGASRQLLIDALAGRFALLLSVPLALEVVTPGEALRKIRRKNEEE
jgi:predicted nucleic acid-binding protein